ncbi:MAG: dipeptidase PepV [Bacillales bacterium]|nr:dipeptidase PepV [Bacillales bacterium]
MKSEQKHMIFFKDYYNQFIEDLEGLLRIPSVLSEFTPQNSEAPFGRDIRKALNYMLAIGERDGFKTVNVDNYCGYIEYGEGSELLVILCHLDVVPATGNWTNPPFDPIIKEGKIYARGAIDDKGPLMASYYALKMLKDNDYCPNKRIRFIFGCDEESGSRGLHHYLSKYPTAEYGFSPDANFPVIYAEKGICSIKFSGKTSDDNLISFDSGTVSNVVPDKATAEIAIDLKNEFLRFAEQNDMRGLVNKNKYTLFGSAAHGSLPETGKNAALYLAYFLSNYISNPFIDFINQYLFFDFTGEKLGIATYDEEMGHVSNNAAIFKLNNNRFEITCNIRYPRNFDFDQNMLKLKEFANAKDMNLLLLYNSKPHYVPKGSLIVRSLMKAYKRWTFGTGLDAFEPISIGGGTYARDFENAVAFGPVFPKEEEHMHMPDEYADLSNLILASFIYQDAIKNICG